jgi:hypothetical protein
MGKEDGNTAVRHRNVPFDLHSGNRAMVAFISFVFTLALNENVGKLYEVRYCF